MCILIFAFRVCYYLAHLYCKICFKSQSIGFRGTKYETFRERLCSNSYHIICPRTFFSWDVVALPRERYTFLSKHYYFFFAGIWSNLCFSSSIYRFIPPDVVYLSIAAVFIFNRKRNYGFTRSTRPITEHERTAICKSQLEAIINIGTQSVQELFFWW